MPPVRAIMSAFNGGELSRRLEGRVDADGIYDRGLAEMLNFVPTVEGPALKRSGFRYIEPALASATWLTPFIFNETQAYVKVWADDGLGAGTIQFFTNDARIETAPGVPFALAVPYTAAEAPKISRVQSFDRIRLAHPLYPPASINRTGPSNFTFTNLALKNGPFKTENLDKSVIVTASATTGSGVTLTCATAIFDPGHVGAPFLLEIQDFASVPAWEVEISGISAGDLRRSDGKVYVAASSGATGSVQPEHTEGTYPDGSVTGTNAGGQGPFGVYWTYLHDRFGICTINAVAPDGKSATVTVDRRLADSIVSSGTYRWAHGAFSDKEGWPHLTTIWAGRQIYFKGLEMVGSVAGDYDDFAIFNDAGEFTPEMGFSRTLDSSDPPIWVKADQSLLVGTASGEILIGQVNPAAAVAGDNIKADPQSSYGSANVWPVDVGTSILFVQRGGRKIREAEYQFQQDRFVGINITAWARHITRSGIVQMAFQQEPEEMLWGVRGDGLLFTHAHSPEQQVRGFARVSIANGASAALSVCSIPSADGTKDELWVLATLGDARGILKLEDWWEENADLDDAGRLDQLKHAFFVDWGVSYDGDPRQTFTTGLSHLEGKEVRVLADGGVVAPNPVVTGGTVSLPFPASVVAIGLGYTARLKPMRPEIRGIGGTWQGLRKRITRAALRLIDSLGVKIEDASGRVQNLIDRPGSTPLGQPIPLFNGDTDNKSVGGGYDRTGQMTVISDDPLPCLVPAIMATVEAEALS